MTSPLFFPIFVDVNPKNDKMYEDNPDSGFLGLYSKLTYNCKREKTFEEYVEALKTYINR